MDGLLNKVAASLSVTPRCPRCKTTIPSDDVNVAKDIAFCRNCNLSHELSALTTGIEVEPEVDLSNPPPGTWHRVDGMGLVAGATHRSLGQAIGLLFFSVFWNGILSIFLMLATASTLWHLGIPLPQWVPSSMLKGDHLPLALTIFLWLFLTPFIAVGLGMILAFLSSLAGRTELRVDGPEAVLFTGISRIGLRKRFLIADVKAVRIEDRRWRDSDGDSRRNTQITIDRLSGKPIRFGSMLTDARRRFLAGAIRKALHR